LATKKKDYKVTFILLL